MDVMIVQSFAEGDRRYINWGLDVSLVILHHKIFLVTNILKGVKIMLIVKHNCVTF
jgi:hypothetical protein